MDPASRFFGGGCLVVSDAPEHAVFGIDMWAWETGPRFRGLKMIPPGIHYVSLQAGDSGPKAGFFAAFLPQECKHVRWDRHTETLEFAGAPVDLAKLEPSLGAYPAGDSGNADIWAGLTAALTPALLHDCIPGGMFDQMAGGDDSGRFGFTPVPQRPQARSPDAITRFAFDRSEALEGLLGGNLVGELQLSFLVLVVGHNFEGFQAWKRLLQLFCLSTALVPDRRDLFARLLETLRWQFTAGTELFGSVLLQEHFVLCRWLHDLVQASLAAGGRLRHEAAGLSELIRTHLGWDLAEAAPPDPDDELPAVVHGCP